MLSGRAIDTVARKLVGRTLVAVFTTRAIKALVEICGTTVFIVFSRWAGDARLCEGGSEVGFRQRFVSVVSGGTSCACRTVVCLVCAASDSVVLTVDAFPAFRRKRAAKKLAERARVVVAFWYQFDWLAVIVRDLLYTPLSRIADVADGFGGSVPHGVGGKTLAGRTSVWIAAGRLQRRGDKLVRVDGAGVAHIGATGACGDVGEDAGLSEIVCGTRRAAVGVNHLRRRGENYFCKFGKSGH